MNAGGASFVKLNMAGKKEFHGLRKEKEMKDQKRKTLLCRALAAVLCFAMMAGVFMPVTAQAASKVELALKYRGKTVVVEKLDADDMDLDAAGIHQTPYKKIKKAFGDARQYEINGGTAYEYKEKGFKFVLEPETDNTDVYGIQIEITSKKAALNGIKVGMSYSQAKKNLQKRYGKSRVITQEDKKTIMLTYGPFMPVSYSFKNGKVSSINFFHS